MSKLPGRTAAIVVKLAGCILLACQPAFAASPSAAQHADWCKRLSSRLPGISTSTCQQSGLQPTGAASRKGFPILMRNIPAGRSGKEPIRILLLGGIHGDELTAAAIVFEWMQWMQAGTAQQFHWNVVPVVNPDGLLAAKPQRVNANGVDLNRNFPTPDWQKDATKYWARVTGSDPRRFPGRSPLSEPETRWLNEEIDRFRPHVIVSVHAPFGVLDFDGPAPVPQRFGRLYFNRVGVYPGSLGNYGGLHKNVPVITIELPNSLKMPPREEVKRIWQDMVGWIDRNVPNKQQQVEANVHQTSVKR
jgi:protein MpaA